MFATCLLVGNERVAHIVGFALALTVTAAGGLLGASLGATAVMSCKMGDEDEPSAPPAQAAYCRELSACLPNRCRSTLGCGAASLSSESR